MAQGKTPHSRAKTPPQGKTPKKPLIRFCLNFPQDRGNPAFLFPQDRGKPAVAFLLAEEHKVRWETNGIPTDGADVKDGADGTDGTDGTNGTNGTDGTNGTNGTDGTTGAAEKRVGKMESI